MRVRDPEGKKFKPHDEKPRDKPTGEIVELTKEGGFIQSNDKKFEFWYGDVYYTPKLKDLVTFQVQKGKYAVEVKKAKSVTNAPTSLPIITKREEKSDSGNWREKKVSQPENSKQFELTNELNAANDIIAMLNQKKLILEQQLVQIIQEIKIQEGVKNDVSTRLELEKKKLSPQNTDFKSVNDKIVKLIQDGKFKDVMEILLVTPPQYIYNTTFPEILVMLKNPRYLEKQTIKDLVDIVCEITKIKHRLRAGIIPILNDQKNLIIGYNRNLSIRSFDGFVNVANKIFDGDGFAMGYWFPGMDKYSWEDLLNSQSFFTMMAIAKPKQVMRFTQLYLTLKQLIVKKEEARTKLLYGKEKIEIKNDKVFEKEETVKNTKLVQVIQEDDGPEEEDVFSKMDQLKLDDSELVQEAKQFLATIPQSKEVRMKKEEIRATVEKIFNSIQKEPVQVYIYGSSETTFGLKDSDVDLCVRFENLNFTNKPKEQGIYLMQLKQAIDSLKYSKTLKTDGMPIGNTRVPVLKVVDSGIECDVCVDNFLGVLNSRMLRCYSQIDERVRQLTLIVKHWTKKRRIADASSGFLSSYSYVLMVLFYLQTLPTPIVPSLQHLAQNADPSLVANPQFFNAFDVRYFNAIDKLKEHWIENANTMDLGELIVGFFDFLNTFDFENQEMSIRFAKSLPKKKENAAIAIEDPFERRDLGKVASDEAVVKIFGEFKRAKTILAESDLETLFQDLDEERVSKFASKKEDYTAYLKSSEIDKGLKDGSLHQGVLRVNAKRFREAYVSVEGLTQDVFIPGFKERNRSMHGDLVAIKISEVNGRSQGNVVGVLEKRSPTMFVCNLLKDNLGGKQQHHRWLIPIEKVYPKFVMETKNCFDTKPQNLEDLILIVEVKEWKETQHHAKAVIIGTLGYQKDLWAQKRSLLISAMPHLYQHIVKKDVLGVATNVKNELTDITEFDKNEYLDWRDKVIFTIDPLTSRDLDDAVSIEKVGDKFWCCVVIADVAKYIQEGDINDLEGKKRSTSVYMVDSVEHMLDPSLSQNLASLLPGVNRYGLCVNWTMDDKAIIDDTSVAFHRIIMQSCCKMDYDTVQEILDNKNPQPKPLFNGVKWDRIKNDCFLLNQLAQVLRKNRRSGGSLFLHSDQLNFNVNDFGYPTSVKKDEHSESHQLIEEFMLVANQLAAKKISKFAPNNCLLRVHEAPDELKIKEILKQYIGVFNKNIAKTPFDLERLEKEPINEVVNSLFEVTHDYPQVHLTIHNLVLRQMNLAKYALPPIDEKPFHYALGVNYYTHFTSPIRRYADVIVHRLLLAAMKEEKTGVKTEVAKRFELGQTIDHINEQTLKARNIQDQTVKMYFAHFLIPHLSKGPVRASAVVLSLGQRSFTCFVPKYGFEMKINIMKTFPEPPDHITDVGMREDEESSSIESVSLVWNDKRKIELKILKTLILELNVDYSMTPYDIYAYNILEFDEKIFCL